MSSGRVIERYSVIYANSIFARDDSSHLKTKLGPSSV